MRYQEKTLNVQWIAIIIFLVVFCAMLWPVYPFFSRIHPFILGMPFALFFLVLLLFMTFTVLSLLFIWESQRGKVD